MSQHTPDMSEGRYTDAYHAEFMRGQSRRERQIETPTACGCEPWRAGKRSGVILCPLHAAAPDLLAALEDLLDLGRAGFIQGADIAVTRSVDAARAAIAKAKA